jgi:hypothetical protein
MDHFAKIFICYQKLGKTGANNEAGKLSKSLYPTCLALTSSPLTERAKLRKELEPWCKKDAKGKARADCDGDKFTIKYGLYFSEVVFSDEVYQRCMGVFDTVGSVGIPESLRIRSAKTVNILGMQDNILGAHVERAYQALALNEERKDFVSDHIDMTKRRCNRES